MSPLMPLAGRVVWVTGSAKRLGRAVALRCASEGADVVVHCNRSRADGEEVAAQIRTMGRRALLVQGDHADAAAVDAMAAAIDVEFGILHALVNCAATFPESEFTATTPEAFDAVIGANVRGPFLCAQRAVPLLRRAPLGHIVNLTDCMVARPTRRYAAYWCAKGGLDALTRALANELAPHILVNSVAPGPMIPAENENEENLEAAVKRSYLRRWGSPDDIADAVLYLLKSNFVTGTSMNVDGGRALG